MRHVEIPLSQGRVALVDAADYRIVSAHSWHVRKKRHTWYAVTNKGGQTNLRMHRMILAFPIGQVDHRNGDGLDNRRANLRIATSAQNQQNRRAFGGTSRFKGVSWHKQRGYWVVDVRVGATHLHGGSFTDEEEAARAYDALARVHFGEFAAMNFPKPGERCALQPLGGTR